MASDNGLNELAHTIEEAPRETARFLRAAIEVTARNIKDQISNDYSGSRGLPHARGAISYDLHGTTGQVLGGISAEIGNDLGRSQGAVVGIVDKGTRNTPGKNRIPKALVDNEEDFQTGIRKAVADGLAAAGL